MTISNEAVEAVAKAISDATYELAWTALPEWVKDQERKDARRLLEVAAPIIRAEALEAAADLIDSRAKNFAAFWVEKNMTDLAKGSWSAMNHDARTIRARAVAERGGK